MLVFYGNSTTSRSKQVTILKAIQNRFSNISDLGVIFVHFVKCFSQDSEQVLQLPGSHEARVLQSLLTYPGIEAPSALEYSERNVVYVLPRPGTVSAWSSKATDIARICNLSQHVERIERGMLYVFTTVDNSYITAEELDTISSHIHDRMTQIFLSKMPNEEFLFKKYDPKPLRVVSLGASGQIAQASLSSANHDLGLALSADEIDYLVHAFSVGTRQRSHNLTDAELFMFAQVNSEHCRHKIFNASWTIDGHLQASSLFEMIRYTEQVAGLNTISAYSDNAAVFEGFYAPRFYSKWNHTPMGPPGQLIYKSDMEHMPILIKVETHNHPTAISPFPGAATGSGGEIRDEGSVGRGSKPKAGLSGFCVSNLLVPGYEQPWETNFGQPTHIASALDIMLDGPLGASAFNNEFGRPTLTGFFRTFAEQISTSATNDAEIRGYHKPIMIAGGLGHVRPQFAKKPKIDPGSKLVVLGGPSLLIGLGGGAASSLMSGSSSADLDFASVQRDNAEMQRRCQQVIISCVDMDNDNPIQSVHDVGAGGLSNALPELVHDSNLGAIIEIRDILVDDSSMSPMEIWCNESQERYVLAVPGDMLAGFEQIAERERCPFSVVGYVTLEDNLVVTDRLLGRDVINLKMSTLFGKPPRMTKKDFRRRINLHPFDSSLANYLPSLKSVKERLSEAVDRVLRLPSVGSKSFLITIGDRSVSGLVTRDQMVGPWQVPVADVAVTRTSYGFDVLTGEAMAMGERPLIALINAAASAKMAVAESLTNLVAVSIKGPESVKLSANWMCAASKEGEGANLYDAVHAIGMELCPALGIGIPVGKDSMSMSMKWMQGTEERSITSPLSLIVTAFASVDNITRTWTPQLRTDISEDTVLLFFDLALGQQRMGGSALAQVFKQIGSETPDVEDPSILRSFIAGCGEVHKNNQNLVLAYHDRSDGGLFTTLVEMCFAGHVGVEIDLDVISIAEHPLTILFNEELGSVFQICAADVERFTSIFVDCGFPSQYIHAIGRLSNNHWNQNFVILHQGKVLFSDVREVLQQTWSETSFRMQSLRDNPDCARSEFESISDDAEGIKYELTFSYEVLPKYLTRPRVAILREQGVNGHAEMAWAFSAAGFEAVDVHMSDIIRGHVTLQDFRGLAACGGFSYGDVLGAGNGWANSILWNSAARREFVEFFRRTDVFSLAVCNGCQLFSHLRHIIPGAEYWPDFVTNASERFEARVSMVEIVGSDVISSSVFLRDMDGSRLPITVAHGEGRVSFRNSPSQQDQEADLLSRNLVAVRYIDWDGMPTEKYPLNPNGSPGGITGLQTPDGRVLALMPHPERVVTLESNSWFPSSMSDDWHGTGPWFRIFQNARKWCG